MKIFRKEKYIETKYKPIHIKRLNEEKIPYTVKERSIFSETFKMVYLCYAIIFDVVVVLGIVWAYLNIGKIL